MSTDGIPKNDVSKVDKKLEKRKVSTSSLNPSSTFYSWWIRAMYNIVYRAKKTSHDELIYYWYQYINLTK